MAITFQLPSEIEQQLRHQDPQLDTHARDQFLVTNYQSGRLSTGDIALILNFETRFEAEEWLATHGANQNYSAESLETDRKNLDQLLGRV